MYLIPIQTPVYSCGKTHYVATDWRRSLLLLRDSLNGRFGNVVVLAPTAVAATGVHDQLLERLSEEDDGIRLAPVVPCDIRCRDYWLRWRNEWTAHLRQFVRSAEVVHAGIADLYRPFAFSGFCEAWKQKKPAVFVQDTDILLQRSQLAKQASPWTLVKERCYDLAYDRCQRFAVRRADLALLKGEALMRRYAAGARNARPFQDTSYKLCEIATRTTVDRRLRARMSESTSFRLVYCGRLIDRKGLDHSIRVIHGARLKGARACFDIIGDGPDRGMLERLSNGLGLTSIVRFCGNHPYGPSLIRKLSEYDAMLFTPHAEDTPRMIFDAYAAGLPVIGFGIEYLRERERADGAVMTVPIHDIDACSAVVCRLASDGRRLAELTWRAHGAADHHAAERWYQRRAEWTFEAVARHRSRSAPLAA